MKVAGFTIARNVIRYDYPIREAILSVLPLVDRFFIAVGKSDDDTLNYIRNINTDKIEILETEWNEQLREGGKVLSLETNKAFDMIPSEYDWAFYIQGDEVLHEKYHDEVRKQMQQWKDITEVQGLLFGYTHFYGSYAYVGDSRRWYRNEIRIIKNDKRIRSYKDAQGFRTSHDEKLRVKKINAEIYHYGWVKPPKAQQEKQKNFHKMWHDDEWVKNNVGEQNEFDYSQIDSLKKFTDSHPALMQDRIKKQDWTFNHDERKFNRSVKDKILHFIYKTTGWIPGEYKNYKIIG
jgi:hypothetical protein